MVTTLDEAVKKAAEAKAKLEVTASSLQRACSKASCTACVSIEANSLVVSVPMEYFGQVQAIIRLNKIACVVRPY
jgi:hypothetical protein